MGRQLSGNSGRVDGKAAMKEAETRAEQVAPALKALKKSLLHRAFRAGL